MKFEMQSLMPAIGIVVGWFLNEISRIIKYKQENKKIFCTSLYSLIELLFILKQKKDMLASAAKANTISDVQFYLIKGLFENEKFKSQEFKKTVNEAVVSISQLDPILAIELEAFASGVDMFDSLNLTIYQEENLSEKFQKHLQLIDTFIIKIDSFVVKLCMKHSLYLLLKYKLYKQRNLKKSSWDCIFDSIK